MKKKIKKTECCRHLDPGTFMLLAVVVVGLLIYFALQANMPLTSFLMLK